MTNPPTTPEAVERTCQELLDTCKGQPAQIPWPHRPQQNAAATLRALSAALEAEKASHMITLRRESAAYARHDARAEVAEAERDCANENWETALKQAEGWKARAEAAEAERDALKEQGEREGASAVDLMIRHMNRWKAAEAKLEEAVDALQEIAAGYRFARDRARASLASIGDKT